MKYVKHFSINGINTKQIACIELNGRPNAATEGAVGVLGIDVTSPTHDVYKCVAVNGSIYTWELLSAGMSVLSADITGEGGASKSFPYSNLRIPNNYLVKVGDLILDSEGYLYQINAIDLSSCTATYTGTHLLGTGGGGKDYELQLVNGELQLVTTNGTVMSTVDYSTHDGITIVKDTAGKTSVKGVYTVDDELVRFFVGTQADYEARGNHDHLFAIITDDDSKAQLDAASAGITYGLEYSLEEEADLTYYLCTGIGSAAATDIVIPSTHNGVPVTEIDASAFQDVKTITSVKLPDGITKIGAQAFNGCKNLRFINIPATVTTIGSLAFLGCTNLTIVCERSEAIVGWDTYWNDGVLNVIYGEPNVDAVRAATAIDAVYAESASCDEDGNYIPDTYATKKALEDYLLASDYTAPSKILTASSSNYSVNLSTTTVDKIVDIIAAQLTLTYSNETLTFNINVPFVDSSQPLKFCHLMYGVNTSTNPAVYTPLVLYIEMTFSGSTVAFNKVIVLPTDQASSGSECTVTSCKLKLRYKA